MTLRAAPLALVLGLALGGPGVAQDIVAPGTGAVVRGLDKLSGKVSEITVPAGASQALDRITITLGECRYPEGNAAGDAFAFLTIEEVGKPDPVFRGWMIASSPALNALDHPRYDVWVLRCTTS